MAIAGEPRPPCPTHLTHASGTICNGIGPTISNGYNCPGCGMFIGSGSIHSCTGRGAMSWINPAPIALYVIQACPVCHGRMTVPPGFYSHLNTAVDLAPETCQTCDGKGLLKVSTVSGNVEKLT